LNDKFQDYLSAENISYKLQVEKEFLRLHYKIYKFDKMTDTELSTYINDIINLNNLA
jgi:predicted fused transcriptional regulator/phosphomethylpyrimidine kinase